MRGELATPFLVKVLEYARARGLDVDQLIRDSSLPPDYQKQLPLPVAKERQMIDEVASRLRDPHLGLHLAQAAPPGAYGLLEFVACNAPTLGDAFERTVRYHRVVSGQWHISLQQGKREWIYELAPVGGRPPGKGRHSHECFVAAGIGLIRSHVEGFKIRRAWFANEPPESPGLLLEFLGTDEVAFGRRTSGYAIDAATAALPNFKANANLLPLLESYANLLPAKPAITDDFVSCVRFEVRAALADGKIDFGRVARALHLSERTLQRRLRELKTSFKQLVDDLRRDLSFEYLAQPKLSPAEVAFLLGYHQPHAFWRAFRRWTGTTPQKYRERLRPLR